MSRKKILIYINTPLLLFVLLTATAFGINSTSTGYKTTGSTNATTVPVWGNCKTVKSISGDIFIPTNTSNEWSLFISRASSLSYVTLGSCIPGAPTITSVPADYQQVTIKWSVPYDGGSNITGYKIYRSTTSGFTPAEGNRITTTSGSATSYIDTGLTSNTIYYYRVLASNIGGDGSASSQVAGYPGALRVFVTSATYTGNLGGLAGADAKCASLAANAGLSGTYIAWLSSASVSASSRIPHKSRRYVTTQGALLANSWADIQYGLYHLIDADENGNPVAWATVYTHTEPSGAISTANPTWHCSNWTSAATGYGDAGNNSNTGTMWTKGGWSNCTASMPARLYCFEQENIYRVL